jgi:hypothetical protein
MIEHVNPANFHISAVRLKIGKAWEFYAFEGALFAQHLDKLLLFRTSVGVSIQIHDIVEIARSGALGQRPEFLGESLDVVIG